MIQFIVAHQPALLLGLAVGVVVWLWIEVAHKDPYTPPRRR